MAKRAMIALRHVLIFWTAVEDTRSLGNILRHADTCIVRSALPSGQAETHHPQIGNKIRKISVSTGPQPRYNKVSRDSANPQNWRLRRESPMDSNARHCPVTKPSFRDRKIGTKR
ncbi:hypothetical protein WR25_00421 [Diploscapter pachys]|uniref:Secreted protein n=1 Tax=Diploscapter pachys TaxID=2018661 RepID=A0A2A2JWF8_9BILA|nr:hypothetical protein WR25_00421 [Diploscapter pachys]